MAASLRLFWVEYFTRNGVSKDEPSYLGEVIAVQDYTQNRLVLTLKTELDRMAAQIHNQNDLMEKWKHDTHNLITRQHQEIERRIQHLEQGQTRVS